MAQLDRSSSTIMKYVRGILVVRTWPATKSWSIYNLVHRFSLFYGSHCCSRSSQHLTSCRLRCWLLQFWLCILDFCFGKCSTSTFPICWVGHFGPCFLENWSVVHGCDAQLLGLRFSAILLDWLLAIWVIIVKEFLWGLTCPVSGWTTLSFLIVAIRIVGNPKAPPLASH